LPAFQVDWASKRERSCLSNTLARGSGTWKVDQEQKPGCASGEARS
jgi:hypothetical protein